MKNYLSSILVLTILLLSLACMNQNDEVVDLNPLSYKTITGKATAIEYGKDGYTATLQTKSNEQYHALVSISNLGPDQYQSIEVNDEATFQGTIQTIGTEEHMKVTKILNIKKNNPALLISEDAYNGIRPGESIESHLAQLEKEVLKNGEGKFDIYRINNEDESYAYLMPDPKDETLVGNIFIDSSKPKTKDGFHVGTTFGELTKKYPNLEVHGSEIEGRTHASIGNLSYRLATNLWTYNVDKSKINPETKVLEIIINK